MKIDVRRLIRGEKGQALVLVIILLLVGGLVIAPLLDFMGTGLKVGKDVYENKTYELYAADAGIEDAMWKLQNPDLSLLPHKGCGNKTWDHDYTIPDVNGKSVAVLIQHLGEGVFKITSNATSDDGGSTTVVSYVEATYVEGTIASNYTAEDGEPMDNIEGDTIVYGEGNLTVTENIQDSATVYVEGDLEVGGNIEGDDVEVYVQGDLIMSGFGNIEDTAIVCVGGDLYIGHCSEDGVEVYVEGNLIGVGPDNGIENNAEVCVEGDITVDNIENGPTVCCNGTLTAGKIEGGEIYAAGYKPFEDCPMCCEDDCRICCQCPLAFTSGEGSWESWEVETYSINP
ncbi:MAG: hypothetical protein ACOC7P_02540 [Chloroflexota bacterium]